MARGALKAATDLYASRRHGRERDRRRGLHVFGCCEAFCSI
jgi:hypothetical protein